MDENTWDPSEIQFVSRIDTHIEMVDQTLDQTLSVREFLRLSLRTTALVQRRKGAKWHTKSQRRCREWPGEARNTVASWILVRF